MDKQQAKPERLLYDVARTADVLDMSASQVRNMINRGELPAVRIGRAVRVPASALREYVDRLVAER